MERKDNFIEVAMKFMQAESEAFKDANIKFGKVTFICPLCGGQAVGNRCEHASRINGLGSGCTQCGYTHT